MKCTIVLSSVTYAMKATKILADGGIKASPVKSPEVIKIRGCGYGVEVFGDCRKAREMLEQNGITVYGVAGEGKR